MVGNLGPCTQSRLSGHTEVADSTGAGDIGIGGAGGMLAVKCQKRNTLEDDVSKLHFIIFETYFPLACTL